MCMFPRLNLTPKKGWTISGLLLRGVRHFPMTVYVPSIWVTLIEVIPDVQYQAHIVGLISIHVYNFQHGVDLMNIIALVVPLILVVWFQAIIQM